jgi:iron complex transport system substrate-binding protein
VISTAPHITELLFAAGGGERVVGAMNFSDYPEAAKRIPVIGSDATIDMERLLALRPDLLVVWQTGNTERQLEQLKSLGIPIFYSEPKKLEEVATSLTRLGQLLGTDATAQAARARLPPENRQLTATYAQRAPVKVFYQIWEKPLFTLNGEHIVSDALRVCGGRNVFAGLKVTAPSVSTEAVLQENPEAILGGERHDARPASISGSRTKACWRSSATICSCWTASCWCAPRRASPTASPCCVTNWRRPASAAP